MRADQSSPAMPKLEEESNSSLRASRRHPIHLRFREYRHDCIELARSTLESRRANVSRRNSSHDFALDQLILEGRNKFFTAPSTMLDHESLAPSCSRARTFVTTSAILLAARSISCIVVKRLTEKRSADDTRARSRPIAKSVGEGSIEPLAQAVPADD